MVAKSTPPDDEGPDSNARIEAIERRLAEEAARMMEERDALRQGFEQLRSEQAQLRRENEERQRDFFLVSGLDAISTVLENGFEQVIGQLEPLTDFRPPTGELPLPERTAYRLAGLMLTQQRIESNTYQVTLTEYDVGFLNDPRDRPPFTIAQGGTS